MGDESLSRKRRFLIPILSLVIISIIAVTTINTYFNITMFNSYIQNQIKEKKLEYLDKHKQNIYNKVHLVDEAIEFQIARIEKRVKNSLKDRIKTSLRIAQFIYDKQKGKLSDEQIRINISQFLSAIRFNDGRGYYFIYSQQNNKVLGHPIKDLIGKDMTNFKDIKGINLVKLYGSKLKDNDIAFVKNYFKKPNNTNKEYPKITCITIFKPLNIVIGTGEYLDVIEQQVKSLILERFSKSKKDDNTYLFILELHNIDGGKGFATMILNPNREDLIGKKLDANETDIKGKAFFKAFLKDLKERGESYTEYWYKKPNDDKPQPKLSYFYLQKDWNWIIGSGFYYDDLEKQIASMKNYLDMYENEIIAKAIMWVLILLMLVILFAYFVSIRIDKTIQNYTNELLRYKDTQREQESMLMEQAKMVQMGEMIGNIAHQWRQPLSVISAASSGMVMQKEFNVLTDEDFIKNCQAINKNVQYLSKTIDTFRDYIKEKKESKNVILQDRINQAINIISASLHNNHIQLINRVDEYKPIEINIVLGELSQVIINIMNNAKDIIVEKNIADGWIKIYLKKNDKYVDIIIEDNGGGIPKEILPKIFDPYFTTKHQSQGTGLGLHMSKNIIEKSLLGKLNVKNTKYGAKFIITIPLN